VFDAIADNEIHRCLRKSDLRCRILIALSQDGPMHLTMLTRRVRSDVYSVEGALYGREDEYSVPHSLLGLALVSRGRVRAGDVFMLTPRGVSALTVAMEVRRERFDRFGN